MLNCESEFMIAGLSLERLGMGLSLLSEGNAVGYLLNGVDFPAFDGEFKHRFDLCVVDGLWRRQGFFRC